MNRLDSPLGSALRRVDWVAAAAVGLLALTGVGMAWLNARSYGQELLTPSSLLVRSLTWTLLSLVVYSVTTLVNWRWVRTFAWPLYAANILLLIVTLVYGVDSGGNNRAIAIFGLAIQASELSKILTLVAISTALTRVDRTSGGVQDLVMAGAIVAPPFLLVVAQPPPPLQWRGHGVVHALLRRVARCHRLRPGVRPARMGADGRPVLLCCPSHRRCGALAQIQ